MQLSNAIKLIIAKSAYESNNWLPLWMHAKDTANVMKYLLHKRYQGLAQICGMSFEDLKKTGILLAYLHDIGKISPLFQAKILESLPERRTVFEHYGIHVPEYSDFINKKYSHHAKCGEAILLYMGFPNEFASIVGAHHGMPAEDVKNHIDNYQKHFFGSPQQHIVWENFYKEWGAFSLERAGFSDVSEMIKLNKRTQILLSGLLIMADWLASDQSKFELIDEDQILSESEYPDKRFETALDRMGLPEVWEPEQERIFEEDFNERFGFFMNEIQKSVIETVEDVKSPGLFILEAPMGIGKTEAALSVAEILANRFEKTGIFFGLPTQATANGIFERVAQWAKLQSSEAFHSINLAHGNAEFQPTFVNMQKSIPCIDEDGGEESGLIVHAFFMGSKQSLLSDFVVGTVDRLLMSVLKKKHAMLLHLGLSQKVVIVDECHAYDAYMNQYLDRALAWLHEYKIPVILLSATLPANRRQELINAYLRRTQQDDEVNAIPYPRLTYTDGEQVRTKGLSLTSSEKKIQIVSMAEEDIIEEIKCVVKAGACAGIICNTVSRAQRFAELAREIVGAKVIIYHAQFIISDRIEKEDALKKAVGKKSDFSMRKGTIVIGTQVLEQSLDIDFDLLITDLCPMDLLLQRIGRMHRHERQDRPFNYNSAKCIVLGVKELNTESEHIYTKWLLLRTRELLPDSIVIPKDIDSLICETYREVIPNEKEGKEAFADYKNLIQKKEQRAKAFLMSPPRDSRRQNNLHDWLENSVGDNEDKALAAVRDGISSIEVIILVAYSDGTLGFLPWNSNEKRYLADICPPENDCRLIAQQKLRLPTIFSQVWNVDRTIEELEQMDRYLTGFQKSHWLKGELVLLLNENLTNELCGYHISYSRDNGLAYIKMEEKTN